MNKPTNSRQAAYFKRRDERIARKKQEDMERALATQNNTKHVSVKMLKSMSLKELIKTAVLIDPNVQAMDVKLVNAEVLRRSKKRGHDTKDPKDALEFLGTQVKE